VVLVSGNNGNFIGMIRLYETKYSMESSKGGLEYNLEFRAKGEVLREGNKRGATMENV